MMSKKGTITFRRYTYARDDRIPGTGHTTVLVGNRVYVYGGYRGGETALSYYCLSKRKWEHIAVEGNRFNHSSVLVDDKMLIFGGDSVASNGWFMNTAIIDLVTHNTHVLHEGQVKVTRDSAVYVERLRSVILVGRVRTVQDCSILSFDVDLNAVSQVQCKGSKQYIRFADTSLLLCEGTVFILFRNSLETTMIALLSFQGHKQAMVSRIKSSVDFVFAHASVLQSFHGLIVFCGGFGRNFDECQHMVTVDPRTGKVTIVKPGDSESELQLEGQWPMKTPGMAGVVANDKMILFGGSGMDSILEFELRVF